MINSIKAVGNSVYILKDSDLYAMDNYCSTKNLSLVLSDVTYFDASPCGCVAVKKDNSVWYCGKSLNSLEDNLETIFIDISDDFSNFDITKGKIYKTYNGMFFLDTDKGILYARGHNRNGELMMGTGTYNKFYPTFQKTLATDVKTFLGAGEATVYYLSTNGNTYGAGYNSNEFSFNQTKINSGPLTSPTKLSLGYNDFYVKPYGIMYTYLTDRVVFIGNNKNRQFPTETVGELRNVLQFTFTPFPFYKNLSTSPYDTAFIYCDKDYNFYGTGIICDNFVRGLKKLPNYNSNKVVKNITSLCNNRNAIFVTDGTDVFYVGLLNETYKDTFTKIDFSDTSSVAVYKSNSTSTSFVLNSANNDISYNTFVENSTYPIKDSKDVYFSANTKDGKSSFKISYENKAYYYGDPAIIGMDGTPSKSWIECTDIFKKVRVVYNDLLHSKYNLTKSGVQVLLPRGHIYSIGSSLNGDIGVNSHKYDGKQVLKFNHLVKTNALNALYMNSTDVYSYYIDRNNHIYISGDSSWIDDSIPTYTEYTKLPIDDKSYDTFLCAKNKSMFLKLGKDLYVLGDVSDGEGGIKPGVYRTPSKVDLPDGLTCDDIQLFDKGTSTPFMYFMTTKGVFYGSGKFPAGTSGVKDEQDLTSFTKLPLTLPSGLEVKDVLELNSSSKTLLMITNTKSVYFCGSSEHIVDPTSSNVVLNWTDKDTYDIPVTDFVINDFPDNIYFCGMKGISTPSITVTPANASGYELTKVQYVPNPTGILPSSRCPYDASTDKFDIPYLSLNSICELDLEYTVTNRDGTTITKTYSKGFNELFLSVSDMKATVGDIVTLEPKFYMTTSYQLNAFNECKGGILKTIGDVVNIKFNKGVYSGSSGKIDWVSTDTGCYDFTGTASKDGSYATNLVSYYKDYNIQLRTIENVKAISREELEKIMEKEEFDALPDEVKDSSSTANISYTKDFDQVIMISAKSLFNTILDTLHIKHK